MLYVINNADIDAEQQKNFHLKSGAHVCYFQYDTFKQNAAKLGISDEYVNQMPSNQLPSFEYYEALNIISMQIPHEVNSKESFSKVYIYMKKNLLVFVCKKHKIIDDLMREIAETDLKKADTERILYLFLNRLISDDTFVLENIEKQIMDIEEALVTTQNTDYVKKIFHLRKKLIILKKYYNQLLDINEGLSENENGILENNDFKLFKQLSVRADRLYNFVLNLREYVTEIREAYQVQMDIRLNSIMKLFTVLTAIFLPLTLIVGWYGMNLKMPEFQWDYGYLFVIVLSILVVIGEIIYFKKNKWF